MKPLVIYHADCTDGFAAAFAAWLKLGDEAHYCAMAYSGKDVPEWRDQEVYILDFSFPRPVMDAIFAEAKRVVWLDHHKTAFEMWEAKFPYHFEKDGADDEKYIVLDNDKSGALLAWEHFHPNKEVPMLIRHIDDRDRWQFKLEGSKEIHATLHSYKPWNFEQWRKLFNSYEAAPGHFLTAGLAVLRAQDQHVARIAKQSRTCRITGSAGYVIGLAVNAPIHQSEIGHELANQAGTFGLVWYLGADSRVKCSLRSNEEYDVSAIAKAFGGGGHRNAAGFETDVQTLMEWLR